MVYESDAEGNRISDFSHAGYHSGTNTIPTLSVVHTISPIAGDNTAHIQAAIDTVAAMPVNASGHRGAILLTKGTYNVGGIVYLNASGIVLRGEGQGNTVNDTIIIGTGTAQMQGLGIVQIQGGSVVAGTTQNITSEYVPAGSCTFEVENGAAFAVGDYVVIKQLATAAWLNAVNYGNPNGDEVPWAPLLDDLTMKFEGSITAISGNKIKLDTPIYNELNRSLAQATVFRHSGAGLITECGVETLRVISENLTTDPYNEAHRALCIHFINVRNCWALNSTVVGFVDGGIQFKTSIRCTVLNCSALDPVSAIQGGRRYNFRTENDCHDILFKGCTASKGRHAFVSNGTAKTSGIVFSQCVATGSYDSSENHRRWGSGILWDQVTFSSPNAAAALDLGIGHNRGDWGTSHGWTGAGMVGWNVTGRHIVVQKPPVGQNYAIACKGTVDGQGPFVYPVGFVEGTGQTPAIPSLYEAQLAERLAYGVGPDAPAKLHVSHYVNTGAPFAALSWMDIALDETAYVVERSSNGGGSYTVLTNLPANRMSYTDTSVALNGSYVYRLKATNSVGSSAYCNPASVNLAAIESLETKTYQAEYFSGSSGCVLKWDGVRWMGQGYVDMGDTNTWFELAVDGGRGGTYTATIRYASDTGVIRYCSVSVNGVSNGTVIFDESPGKSEWRTETINLALSPGINTVRLQPADGTWGPDVDYLQLAVLPSVYAAGETAPSNTAAQVFDSNLNTDWKHYSPYASWIERAFSAALAITNYTLTSSGGVQANDQANDPKDWKLLGSNDGGTNWTTLDAQSGITFSARRQSKSFALSGGASYKLYRLEVTAVQDLSTADSVRLAELSFPCLPIQNSPPVYEGFETNAAGTALTSMTSQGWSASAVDVVVIASNSMGAAVAGGTNAVAIPLGAVVSNLMTSASPSVIWVDFQKRQSVIQAVDETALLIDGNAAVQVCLNTNRSVWLYDKGIPGWTNLATDYWGTNVSAFSTSDWTRVTIYENFATNMAALFLDGHLIRDQIPFITNRSSFAGFRYENGASGTNYLDEVRVWTNVPPGLTADLDNDAVADAQELQTYGNISTWHRLRRASTGTVIIVY